MNINFNKIKENLKTNFKGNYEIPEVILYIDEINSIKIIKYYNLILKIYYKKEENLDFNFIKRILKRGRFIIKNKKIIINLIPSGAKKILDEENVMTGKNINSGFTYIYRNEIFIFRKEEFPKVIIHELIHHNLNIHNDIFKDNNKKRLKEHFKISDDTILILNEAIIEMWASIFQLAFISMDYNLNFKKLYHMELTYSLFKCFQIFKIQNNNIWYDKCNIFSYIIFKTILLINLNKLIKIYMYPNKYDDTIITNFILKYSKIPEIKNNPEFIIKINNKENKIKREEKSLCFMLFSDL